MSCSNFCRKFLSPVSVTNLCHDWCEELESEHFTFLFLHICYTLFKGGSSRYDFAAAVHTPVHLSSPGSKKVLGERGQTLS